MFELKSVSENEKSCSLHVLAVEVLTEFTRFHNNFNWRLHRLKTRYAHCIG